MEVGIKSRAERALDTQCKGNMLVFLLFCIFGFAILSWVLILILDGNEEELSLEKSTYHCDQGKCFVEYVVRNNTDGTISYVAEIRVFVEDNNSERLIRLIQFPFTLTTEYKSSSYLFETEAIPSEITVTLIKR